MIKKNVVAAGASLYALLPFLWWGRQFCYEWPNHVWLVTYYAEYFLKNGRFPLFLNTFEKVGYAQPLFYGGLFYKLLAAAAVLLGSAAAMRLAAFVFLYVQFLLLRRLVRFFSERDLFGEVVAVLWTWSIYSLTNFYARAAITEFFAVIFLTCALCCFLLLIFDYEESMRLRLHWALALFYILVSSHPITFLMGTVMMVLLFLACLPFVLENKKVFRVFALDGFLVAVCASPWIYLTEKYRSALNISTLYGIDLMPDSVGKFWMRVLPVPFDIRSHLNGVAMVSTPFLDSQMGMPLLALFLVIFWQVRKKLSRGDRASWIFLVGFFVFIMSFAMTLSKDLWIYFIPTIFHKIQIAYRMIGYIDLGVLIMLVAALLALGKGRVDNDRVNFRSEKWKIFFAVLVTVAAVGVFEKWMDAFTHAPSFEESYTKPLESKVGALHLPPTFYGFEGYSTPSLFPKSERPGNTALLTFAPDDGRFGMVNSVREGFTERKFVVTNVLPFPWNKIEDGGRPVDMMITGNTLGGGTLGFYADAGSHEFSYHAKVDAVYEVLDWAGTLVFFGLLAFIAVLWGREFYFRWRK